MLIKAIQSLYSSNSVPAPVRRLNNALMRADQIHCSEGKNGVYSYAPIVADAKAGFGGPLHAFELMKQMIEAGAAGVHFEGQLAAEKKCGHLGARCSCRPRSSSACSTRRGLRPTCSMCPRCSWHAPTRSTPRC